MSSQRAAVLASLMAAMAGFVGAVGACAQDTGQIQGTVVAGKRAGTLKGATVAAYRLNPAPAFGSQTTIDANGNFTVGSLQPGRYGLCATDTTNTLLNGCEWRQSEVTVDVTNGATAGPVTITLLAPSVLHVRLNDTGSSLAKNSSDAFPPHVMFGIWDTKGVFHPLLETHKDASGIDLQARIPFDTPLRLHVQSQLVALETSGHTPVPLSGYDQVFLHDSSKSQGQQPTFTFSAIGRN